MATPIKYFSPDIRRAYGEIEQMACGRLTAMLPEDVRGDIAPLLNPDTSTREYRIVKAADKLSAYIKCVEELKAGNAEFARAKDAIQAQLEAVDLPELHEFIAEFGYGFALSLDELN